MSAPRATSRAGSRTGYRCEECGWESVKWVGRCGSCQAWGSLAEAGPATSRVAASAVTAPAVPIGQVPLEESTALASGVPELDRVLGGGLVPGAVVLLAGEPGVGKSTLLLEAAAQTARAGRRALYVSGEESAAQVRLRADRCRGVHHSLFLAAETGLGAVLSHVEAVQPDLLVVDSVQTIAAEGADGVPGGVSQVKEVAGALVRTAKARGMATVIVGHVTKDGTVAGPRVLEHLVDVVLHFEGERDSRLRLVRAVKNRFGPVDEVGCFDLSGDGIVAVTDPAGLFVARHHEAVPGSCLAVTMQGRRPMPVEVQALVLRTVTERPRRATSGVDSSRVALVLAVLQARAAVVTTSADVFVSTVGGARLTEPATDLALALALASSSRTVAVPRDLVAIGEVGLAGELRRVRDLPLRVAEVARLGFRFALVPAEAAGSPAVVKAAGADVRLLGATDLSHAIHLLELVASAP